MDIKFVQILNSRRKESKYQANFLDSNHNVIKKTDFGSKNGITYNMDHDMEKKTELDHFKQSFIRLFKSYITINIRNIFIME